MERPGEHSESDWAAFYVTHRVGLAAYARALSRDAADAQDLIQDVLVRMVREGRPALGARPVVFRALRNLAIDRQRRRKLEASALPLIRPRLEAPADAEDRERLESLAVALDELSDAQREVIVLRTYAGLSFEEIAGALERPVGTVASQYARGVDALRTAMKPEKHHV